MLPFSDSKNHFFQKKSPEVLKFMRIFHIKHYKNSMRMLFLTVILLEVFMKTELEKKDKLEYNGISIINDVVFKMVFGSEDSTAFLMYN